MLEVLELRRDLRQPRLQLTAVALRFGEVGFELGERRGVCGGRGRIGRGAFGDRGGGGGFELRGAIGELSVLENISVWLFRGMDYEAVIQEL